MVCFDLSTSQLLAGQNDCALTKRETKGDEWSLQAIGCPLTQLSVFMLSDIHTGLCWDSFAGLIAVDNGQVKSKPGIEILGRGNQFTLWRL